MGERTPGARDAIRRRVEVIAERATAYAERDIETVELVELTGADIWQTIDQVLSQESVPLDVAARNRLAQKIALTVAGCSVVAHVATENMHTIAHALARAYTVGYGTKIEESEPMERLGGAAEDARRRGRRRG